MYLKLGSFALYFSGAVTEDLRYCNMLTNTRLRKSYLFGSIVCKIFHVVLLFVYLCAFVLWYMISRKKNSLRLRPRVKGGSNDCEESMYGTR